MTSKWRIRLDVASRRYVLVGVVVVVNLATLGISLDAASTVHRELVGDVVVNREIINAAGETIAQLEAQVETDHQAIVTNEGNITALQQQVTALQSQIAQLAAVVAFLQSAMPSATPSPTSHGSGGGGSGQSPFPPSPAHTPKATPTRIVPTPNPCIVLPIANVCV